MVTFISTYISNDFNTKIFKMKKFLMCLATEQVSLWISLKLCLENIPNIVGNCYLSYLIRFCKV